MCPGQDDSCLNPWKHRSRARERGRNQKLEICRSHNPEGSLLSQWKHLSNRPKTRDLRKTVSKSLGNLRPNRWRPLLDHLAGTRPIPQTSRDPRVDSLRSQSKPHRAVAEGGRSKEHRISSSICKPLQPRAAARKRQAPMSHHMSPSPSPDLYANLLPSY
jgi:hypothetical protein